MAFGSYGSCVFCRAPGVLRMVRRVTSAAPKPESQVDFLNGKPHRDHDGLTNLKTLHLPAELQMAARSIIRGAQVSRLTSRAQDLTNLLWSRKRAVEDSSLRRKAMALERQLWENEMEKGEDVDVEVLENRIRRKVLSELKRTTFHWSPLKYDEELGVVYMAARLAGGYAAVRRALNEIKKRDPDFAPQSLLDFGSGLGTVAWASHSCWGDTLNEMVCVDSSGPMNILAERLLKGDDEKGKPHFQNVYFRQLLPVSPRVQFDLVVSAFTLSELASTKEREDMVVTLWRKTSSYLVLVENGTKEGHQILMEARDILLKNREKTAYDTRPASMFAPCPHEQACPKLALKLVVPCNFQQPYQPLPLPRQVDNHIEKFSYVILTRTQPAKTGQDAVDWPRLIAAVQPRSRHVHCHLCCSNGQLQHLVVTASKHSRDVYRCARISHWGDRIPLVPKTEDDVQSDSE